MLIAWSEAIAEASILIDPTAPIVVDLIGTEVACLRLHAVLRFIETGMDRADSILAPYPRIKAALALNVFVFPGGLAAGVAGGLIVGAILDQPDLPEPVRSEAQAAETRVRSSRPVQQKVEQFYRTADGSRAVTGLKMYEDDPRAPIVKVPRERFAEYGGLWTPQDADASTRPRYDVWDIIVTHPAAIAKPRVWGFKRDGMPFRAKMIDPYFLTAIKERTLPLLVHEGSLMRARVEWVEELQGDEWVTDTKSFRITQVLWPTPLKSPEPLPLLPDP
jgi:hypothetical protein